MTTFVLVPGGWQGGWVYRQVAEALVARGHAAHPVTLSGLAERAHLLTAGTNLDTHIADVVALLKTLDDRGTDAGTGEVVLCGHSYGGMVITGVADRVPERIARLVYIDAYVPADGDSCWSLTTEAYQRIFIEGAGETGYAVSPPWFLDGRTTPHPLATLTQRIRLTGAGEKIARREFVYLSGWQATPFTDLYLRLRDDPKWIVHALHTGHDIMTEAPEKLLPILLG